MNMQAIHQEATQAAKNAAQEFLLKHGDTPYCGFAWVEAQVGRTNSKIAKELKSIGFSNSWLPKRVYLWNPAEAATQSMDVLEAGARAYAEVLRKHGIEAYMHSRPD